MERVGSTLYVRSSWGDGWAKHFMSGTRKFLWRGCGFRRREDGEIGGLR